MARPIYVPQDEADRIIAELKAQMSNSKCFGGIDINTKLKSDNRCALLYFSPTAWVKMTTLVSEFTTEVQWHGLVRRHSECEFEIYDILVPPHSVTAATVTSDPVKYSEWINGLEDEKFNDLRFHGHSHAKMSVTPSVTDKDYRKDVMTQLPKSDENNDVFYIFLIINKNHVWSAEIYDLTYNALYSTDDKEIEMMVMFDDECSLDGFIAEAKRVAVATPSYTTKGYSGYSGYPSHTPALNGGSKGTDYGSAWKNASAAGTGYSKKNVEKSKNKRDDDDYYGVDEDPTDPFYARDGWGGY